MGMTLLFAGGGSGGHISPGLAIAERLDDVDPQARCVFACSDRAVDAHMLRAAGRTFEAVAARPPGLHPRRAAAFARAWPRVRRQVRALVRAHRIDHVIALGGFVAAPTVAAARTLGVPATLINLDAVPGRANRWIARRGARVWSAVPVPDDPGFAEAIVGMPVRRDALPPAPPADCRAALGLAPDRPVLLVTGASQGASTLNDLVPAIARAGDGALDGWQVLHLAGAGRDDVVRRAYAEAGARATVLPFLDRMGLAWGAADLAVSRSGANSVAEVAASTVPTLFLPYPHHRDQHQRRNALPLESIGGAIVAEDLVDAARNLAAIGPVLRRLLVGEVERRSMRRALEESRPVDAALAIARRLLERAAPIPA